MGEEGVSIDKAGKTQDRSWLLTGLPSKRKSLFDAYKRVQAVIIIDSDTSLSLASSFKPIIIVSMISIFRFSRAKEGRSTFQQRMHEG